MILESIFDLGQSCDQSIEPIIPFKMAANVQSMCQYWKKFDLQDLQVMMPLLSLISLQRLLSVAMYCLCWCHSFMCRFL